MLWCMFELETVKELPHNFVCEHTFLKTKITVSYDSLQISPNIINCNIFHKGFVVRHPLHTLELCLLIHNITQLKSSFVILDFNFCFRAAEFMTKTGHTVTLKVAKQGAIYHGLATLLSQPSPVMQRGRAYICIMPWTKNQPKFRLGFQNIQLRHRRNINQVMVGFQGSS